METPIRPIDPTASQQIYASQKTKRGSHTHARLAVALLSGLALVALAGVVLWFWRETKPEPLDSTPLALYNQGNFKLSVPTAWQLDNLQPEASYSLSDASSLAAFKSTAGSGQLFALAQQGKTGAYQYTDSQLESKDRAGLEQIGQDLEAPAYAFLLRDNNSMYCTKLDKKRTAFFGNTRFTKAFMYTADCPTSNKQERVISLVGLKSQTVYVLSVKLPDGNQQLEETVVNEVLPSFSSLD